MLLTLAMLTVASTIFILRARRIVFSRMDARIAELESRGRPLLKPPVIGRGPQNLTADYDWTLQTLDEESLPFARFQGRAVFLTFWATWCQPCVAELPTIQALATRFRNDSRLAFVLATEEDASPVREFVRGHGLALPVYLIREGIPANIWAEGLPVTQVIDCRGRVVLRHDGAANWNSAAVIAFLQRTLDDASCATSG